MAKPLQIEIPLMGYLEDQATYLTKSGDCGCVIRVDGIDPDCLSNQEANYIAERFELACRAFNDRMLFQQIFFRKRLTEPAVVNHRNAVLGAIANSRAKHLVDTGLFTEEIYYLPLYLDPRAQRTLLQSIKENEVIDHFKRRRNMTLYEEDVLKTQAQLKRRTASFIKQLTDILPMRVLPAAESFQVLRRLLNFDGSTPTFATDEWLDYRLGDSSIDIERDHLMVGRHYTVAMSLKALPRESSPLIWRDLQKLSGANFHFVLGWQPLPPGQDAKELRRQRRHWHAAAVPAGIGTPKENSRQLLDLEKVQREEDLGEVQRHLARDEYSGFFSGAVIVYDQDRTKVLDTVAEIQKVFERHGATLIVHTSNQFPLLLSTVPGGYHRPHHRLMVQNVHHADMSLWSMSAKGEARNERLNGDSLAVLKSSHGTAFNLNLYGTKETGMDELGHAFCVGRPRAGKSVLANLLVALFQKHDPYTLIFDVGGSYEGITAAFEGAHIQVSAEAQGFSINPFACELTPANHQWLTLFVRALAESGGSAISDSEQREIHEEIGSMFKLDVPHTLGNLLPALRTVLQQKLNPWVSGQYRRWFNNERDTVSLKKFSYLDFPDKTDPRVLSNLFLYFFHRQNELVLDPTKSRVPKLFVIDEAWRFLPDGQVAEYVLAALRTWPKHLGSVILLTQLAAELDESKIVQSISKLCATRLFLSQPTADGDYSRCFGLAEEEIAAIRGLRAQDELLFKQAGRGKRLSVCLDPLSRWLCTTDAEERKVRAGAFEKYGVKRGLELLANGGLKCE